jgi:hypothetical protein
MTVRSKKKHTRGWPLKRRLAFYSRRYGGKCRLWIGCLDSHGYGKISYGGRTKFIRAHVASWIACHGPVPEGLNVLHKCDIPSCIRPSHLFLGTHDDNMRDKAIKGRAAIILTADDVRKIRVAKGSQSSIGRQFGVSQTTVWEILSGRTWSHLE